MGEGKLVCRIAAAATNLATDCAEIATKTLRDLSLITSIFIHPFYRVSLSLLCISICIKGHLFYV